MSKVPPKATLLYFFKLVISKQSHQDIKIQCFFKEFLTRIYIFIRGPVNNQSNSLGLLIFHLSPFTSWKVTMKPLELQLDVYVPLPTLLVSQNKYDIAGSR